MAFPSLRSANPIAAAPLSKLAVLVWVALLAANFSGYFISM
jgi:hypothetical protein